MGIVQNQRKAWNQIHSACELLKDCECYDMCLTMTRGMHDVVNSKLGKPIHDKNNFKEFVKLVNRYAQKTNTCQVTCSN